MKTFIIIIIMCVIIFIEALISYLINSGGIDLILFGFIDVYIVCYLSEKIKLG